MCWYSFHKVVYKGHFPFYLHYKFETDIEKQYCLKVEFVEQFLYNENKFKWFESKIML